jgi:hypothetical protein
MKEGHFGARNGRLPAALWNASPLFIVEATAVKPSAPSPPSTARRRGGFHPPNTRRRQSDRRHRSPAATPRDPGIYPYRSSATNALISRPGTEWRFRRGLHGACAGRSDIANGRRVRRSPVLAGAPFGGGDPAEVSSIERLAAPCLSPSRPLTEETSGFRYSLPDVLAAARGGQPVAEVGLRP